MAFATDSINFGTVTVGLSSAPARTTLNNVGAAPVNITAIKISPSGIFAQTNNCPATLNPGQSCTFQVVFTPPSAGNFNGTLAVYHNAKGSPQTVALTGAGVGGGRD